MELQQTADSISQYEQDGNVNSVNNMVVKNINTNINNTEHTNTTNITPNNTTTNNNNNTNNNCDRVYTTIEALLIEQTQWLISTLLPLYYEYYNTHVCQVLTNTNTANNSYTIIATAHYKYILYTLLPVYILHVCCCLHTLFNQHKSLISQLAVLDEEYAGYNQLHMQVYIVVCLCYGSWIYVFMYRL